MPSISISKLSRSEIPRVGEIDRTEKVRVGYHVEDGQLARMAVVWDSSPWRAEGEEHSIPQMVRGLEEIISHAGVMLGAFDGDRLVGIAAFRPRLTETTAQLAFLHVSNGYRRRGIASRFYERIEELARQSGAEQLYVSATPSESAVGFYSSRGFELTPTPHPELFDTPSESAVGFYSSRGFELTPTPHPELFELEPEDIHMIKGL